MYRIRLKARPDLFVGKKDISYALKSDQTALFHNQNRNETDDKLFQYNAHWWVSEERARVFPSIKEFNSSVGRICDKQETYSRLEVVFIDGTTKPLDDFLKEIRTK